MTRHRSNPLRISRLRPLVVGLAVAFGTDVSDGASVVGRDPPSTTLLVQNCDDSGPDSLRDAVDTANALTGDVTIQFDLNAMQCSTITLTSGAIEITRDDLTLQGPGADLLTIDGGYSSVGQSNRILHHTGQGTLAIEYLTLTDAKYFANAAQFGLGGCVYGYTVNLIGVNVSNCRVVASGTSASGGGVAARFSMTMVNSSVSDCAAISDDNSASGGGVFVGSLASGNFTAKYSTIANNTVHSYGSFTGDGGGLLTKTQTTQIQRSTISGNHAQRGGGLYAQHSILLSDSTVSDNQADNVAGIQSGPAVFYSSTLAFNTATAYGRTAGLSADSIQSYSSIFAFNVTDDGSTRVETDVESGDNEVFGADNLVMAVVAGTVVPVGTLSACPRLAPLLDNGGVTLTHGLLPGSPAIDTGNNNENLDTDQRGTGFARVVGAAPDIGAYEWSAGSGEEINASGFEACE